MHCIKGIDPVFLSVKVITLKNVAEIKRQCRNIIKLRDLCKRTE
jgi:hypothetical protein